MTDMKQENPQWTPVPRRTTVPRRTVIVCGGRDWDRRELTFQELDRLRAELGITTVVHGAARGADNLAGEWARARNIAARDFPAQWNKFGRRAGFLRNQQMLDEGRPDAVIAFPGGAGTRGMMRIAREAGVPVIDLTHIAYKGAPSQTSKE